jgi:hypothetical protein
MPRDHDRLSHGAADVPTPQREVRDARAVRVQAAPGEGVAGHTQAGGGQG